MKRNFVSPDKVLQQNKKKYVKTPQAYLTEQRKFSKNSESLNLFKSESVKDLSYQQ